jgi:UDP-N-acetylmuramate dehydrogenase
MVLQKLKTLLPFLHQSEFKILSQAKLSDYTTFRLGGVCRGLINCETPQELERVVRKLADDTAPFILIGGGSNLVVSDEGLDCYVIRYCAQKPLMKRVGNDLIVSGSTAFDELAKVSCDLGLEGAVFASGIPGTLGGAIVGNAGAFGKQVGDILKSVTAITRQGKKKILMNKDLGFSYRNSFLKETGDIVLSARFALRPGKKESLLKERQEILALRSSKHPDLKVFPCAGSFFRNIEPTSKAEKRQATGWFLEQAGGKDLKHGGAMVYEKHANIIVKGPQCKSQDVYELQKEMIRLVKQRFNLDLVREVRFVGKFEGMPKDVTEMIW